MTVSYLPGWQTQHQWYEQQGRLMFPRRTQWEWFYRRNRSELAKQGAIAVLGRSVLVNKSKLAPLIEQLAVKEAQRRTGNLKPQAPEEGGVE